MKFPCIGQGIGEYKWTDHHVESIQMGILKGMNLIDTAEKYDNGQAERIAGEAIKPLRTRSIIATKFSPEHNRYADVKKAAEGSLRRLGVKYIDIYQMHWPNPEVPIEETMQAMKDLVLEGKIKYIGVGNLSLSQLKKACSCVKVSTLQMEYNLFDRFIEDAILPFCRQHNITVIAYSPLDQGHIVDGDNNRKIIYDLAEKYNKEPSQIALRWLSRDASIVSIPKSSSEEHITTNAESIFPMSSKDIQLITDNVCGTRADILPSRISVSLKGEGNKKAYQTLEEAIDNHLGFVPSPVSLSKIIREDSDIKPVRVIEKDGSYILIEGRVRYWAWVIAFGFDTPISAYIRKDWL